MRKFAEITFATLSQVGAKVVSGTLKGKGTFAWRESTPFPLSQVPWPPLSRLTPPARLSPLTPIRGGCGLKSSLRRMIIRTQLLKLL
jgi:hypothetical protein